MSGSTHDPFTQIENARQEIKARFEKLVGAVRERESALQNQLDEIERNLKEKVKNERDVINRLEASRKHCTEDLNSSMVKGLMEGMLAHIEDKLNEIKLNETIGHVRVQFTKEVFSSVKEYCTIHSFELDPLVVDYCQRVDPILKKGIKGEGEGELNDPYMVTTDPQTGNIYVVNRGNDCVLVFSSEGEYLFTFGNKVAGWMNRPISIAISEDKVYVTQEFDNCINAYELDGTYLCKFGEEGAEDGQLNTPLGMAINYLGDIYVCDSKNNRVAVYDKDLEFKSNLTHRELIHPRGIQFTDENILVLAKRRRFGSKDNNLFFIFTQEHEFIRKMYLTGVSGIMGETGSFCLDAKDNIFMSDWQSECVYIFTMDGKLVHQIGNCDSELFSSPYGVAIDNRNRIIVLDEKEENCLQFF